MAIMTFIHFPEVKKIKAGLLFVMHDSFMPEEYDVKDIDKLWNYFLGDLKRLEISFDNNLWIANPTGLCGWCPVKKCEFHKER
jgi:hypothetical protein